MGPNIFYKIEELPSSISIYQHNSPLLKPKLDLSFIVNLHNREPHAMKYTMKYIHKKIMRDGKVQSDFYVLESAEHIFDKMVEEYAKDFQ